MAIYRFIEPRLGRVRVRLRQWRFGALRVLSLLAVIIQLSTVGLALLDNLGEPLSHRLLIGLWNSVNLVTTLGDFTSSFDPRQKTFMMGASCA